MMGPTGTLTVPTFRSTSRPDPPFLSGWFPFQTETLELVNQGGGDGCGFLVLIRHGSLPVGRVKLSRASSVDTVQSVTEETTKGVVRVIVVSVCPSNLH